MRKLKGIKIFSLILIISSLQITSLVSATTTVVFNPTYDTMIKYESPYTPYGNLWHMAVRNVYGDSNKNFYEIDSLISFNIFSIPSTATILSATLYMYYYNWSGTNPAGRNLTLYLITSSWNEQYVYWNTQPSYAIMYSSSSFVPNSVGQWMKWDVTNDIKNLVKERAYYGWKIADENNWEKPNVPMTYFRTKEYGNYIPYLEVSYTVAEANIKPIPGFFITANNPSTKDSIQFTDTSYDPDGTITDWFWNFGDGNSSTSKTPTHTYTQSGHYTVTLQVTDDKGMTNSISSVLSISSSNSTPGFEFLIVVCAIAFILCIKFKVKKRK
ncbi:hypothetical protein AYK25_07575 [Thermoplasmatales archaeon SM1-50]|nr:MAG: hypothetical protein AYK25_07575 [Thermoplasmatales archaeon SM1-50]